MAALGNKGQKPHGDGELWINAPPEGLLERILDRYMRATFAITADRKLLYQNAAARALSARKDWVKINDGRLHFVDRTLLKEITEHLAGQLKPPHAMMLRSLINQGRDSACVTYRMLVTPLHIGEGGPEPQVWLLFVSEFQVERQIDGEVLRQLYGLTRTESMLVVQLFAGKSLAAAAATLEVSINTAKTLLRRVFQKCKVQSQGELLQLVALGPRAL